MVEVDPKYADHPMYQDIRNTRLQVLGDYLQMATLLWATHHEVTLPIADYELRQDIDAELEEFKTWLKGELEPFTVIDGGKEG